jgi:hypothetical protein
MFLNRLLLLLYIKVEGPIYAELFKTTLSCQVRTLEHHFSCPSRHKINNNVKHVI